LPIDTDDPQFGQEYLGGVIPLFEGGFPFLALDILARFCADSMLPVLAIAIFFL
jgi:hypothetical protein